MFIFCHWEIFLRSTILLLGLQHTLECIHVLLHAPLHPTKLDGFVALILQDIVAVLSDVIEYHCPFYTGV